MNLNPKNKEKKFQHNEIEPLLKRIKNETYLNKSGWDIIQNDGYYVKGTFDFNQGKNLHF
jgi:methionine-rich copper-binding protein CopC